MVEVIVYGFSVYEFWILVELVMLFIPCCYLLSLEYLFVMCNGSLVDLDWTPHLVVGVVLIHRELRMMLEGRWTK
jgi:hypothetical protein